MMRGAGLAAATALLLAPLPAGADEAIARRLAALRSLVDPVAARPAASAALPGSGACPPGTWWRMTGYGVTDRIDRAVRDASIRFAVDPRLIRSVIRHESNYHVEAVSPKGALGLMQLMPRTARAMGVVCPFDPRENVLGGTRYLRLMKDRFATWRRALAAYHAGPTATDSGRLPEVTRRYVDRVLRTWRSDSARRVWLR